jgi:hypothetical protein
MKQLRAARSVISHEQTSPDKSALEKWMGQRYGWMTQWHIFAFTHGMDGHIAGCVELLGCPSIQ